MELGPEELLMRFKYRLRDELTPTPSNDEGAQTRKMKRKKNANANVPMETSPWRKAHKDAEQPRDSQYPCASAFRVVQSSSSLLTVPTRQNTRRD